MRAFPPLPTILPLLALAFAACGGADESARLSGLLITLDTTRVDALSCYGNPQGTTPNLDRLASEGILYEAAHTTVPLTLPAHASMLTGLYPPRHGLRDNGIASLSPDARTLAELARDGGYQTAAFVGSVVLDGRLGLDQGFDHYEHPQRTAAGEAQRQHGAELRAGEVVDRALRWFEARDTDAPFFAWVHFYDPHHPFAPPADFDATRWKDEPYLAEVAYTDRELGRLLDALRDDGALARTVVMVVSDHGEAFGAHGEFSHGALCYEPTLHVPFLLRRPADPRAGDRSRDNASVADVMPTLAVALGLDVPAGIDGVDLLSPVSEERGTYFESYYGYLYFGWSPLAGWLARDGKYLHSSTPLFHDLAADPAESIDLSADKTHDAYAARAAIARIFAAPALTAVPAGGDVEGLLDDLRDLGYVGGDAPSEGFPPALAPSELPAPHEGSPFLEQRGRAQRLEQAGRKEEALAIYTQAIEANPHNTTAYLEQGRMLLQLGRAEEAVRSLQRTVVAPNPKAQDFFGLGTALLAAGRPEEALAPLGLAVILSRGRPRYLQLLVDTLRGLGRDDEAREVKARYPEKP